MEPRTRSGTIGAILGAFVGVLLTSILLGFSTEPVYIGFLIAISSMIVCVLVISLFYDQYSHNRQILREDRINHDNTYIKEMIVRKCEKTLKIDKDNTKMVARLILESLSGQYDYLKYTFYSDEKINGPFTAFVGENEPETEVKTTFDTNEVTLDGKRLYKYDIHIRINLVTKKIVEISYPFNVFKNLLEYKEDWTGFVNDYKTDEYTFKVRLSKNLAEDNELSCCYGDPDSWTVKDYSDNVANEYRKALESRNEDPSPRVGTEITWTVHRPKRNHTFVIYFKMKSRKKMVSTEATSCATDKIPNADDR